MFHYSYHIHDKTELGSVAQLYKWATDHYVMNILLPLPDVSVMNHEHLQSYCNSRSSRNINGQVYAVCLKDSRIILSDRLKLSNSKHRAVLVHEFIHYFQLSSGRKFDVELLEHEANRYENLYLSEIRKLHVDINRVF